MKTKLDTLTVAVERYQRSLENLAVINEELRTLPPSARVADILELNEQTIQTTRRLLETAQERLRLEQQHGVALGGFSWNGA